MLMHIIIIINKKQHSARAAMASHAKRREPRAAYV